MLQLYMKVQDACAFLEEFLSNHQSVIICGDFKIQHCGNTLDLIMVRESSKIILTEPTKDYLISDHSFFHTCISVLKPNCKRKLPKFWCIKDINKERMKMLFCLTRQMT